MEKILTIQLTEKELTEVIHVLDYIVLDELTSGIKDEHEQQGAFTNSILEKLKTVQRQAQG